MNEAGVAQKDPIEPGVGRLELTLLVLAIVLVPLNIEWRISNMGVSAPDIQQSVAAYPFDIPLLGLALVCVGRLVITRSVRQTWLVGASAALLVLLLVSVLVTPSLRGIQAVTRVCEAGSVLYVVARLRNRGVTIFVTALVAVASLQAALGLLQALTGETVGLTILGEHPPLETFGDSEGVKGTFVHRYIFAGLVSVALIGASLCALVTRRPLKWWLATGLLSCAFALTYSRAGAIGLALALAAFSWGATRYRQFVVAIAFICLGTVVAVVASPDGWIARVEQSVGAPTGAGVGLDAVSSERVTLARQSLKLIANHPFSGVGAGYYMFAVTSTEDVPPPEGFKPVHNVPLLVAAESGIAAGAIVVVLLIALGVAAVRGGPGSTALFLVYLPFVMLDHFPYDAPMGIIISGLWAGGVSLAARVLDIPTRENPPL